MSRSTGPAVRTSDPRDVLAVGPYLQRIFDGEDRYGRYRERSGLDAAIEAWEALCLEEAWVRVDPDVRCELSLKLSEILRERYEIAGDVDDLTRAVELAEDAATLAREGSARFELVPFALVRLAEGLAAVFDRTGDPDALDRAVAALDEAQQVAPDESAVALARSNALLLRFKSFGVRTDIDAAVKALEDALERGDAARRASALDRLGAVLLVRVELTGGADLEAALRAFEEAVALEPSSPWFRANLAVGLGTRAERDGSETDAQRALALLEAALREIPPEAPDRLRVEQNALAAARRLDRSGSGPAEATAARRLAETTREAARARPTRLAAFGVSLVDEFENSLDVSRLDAATTALREAAAAAPAGSVDRPNILDGLGYALSLRYALLGDEHALDEAVTTGREAVSTSRANASELARHMFNLALSLSLRAARTSTDNDIAAATRMFREACSVGLDRNPEVALRAAQAWASWAAEAGALPDAAEAVEVALAAADRAHRLELGRRHKEAWLTRAPNLAATAAVALAQAGDLEAAVLALETGRARLLADALDLDDANLDRLEELGRGELIADYRAATAGITALERVEPAVAGYRDKHARAFRELERIAARIRSLPGYEDFLRPVDIAAVRRAAEIEPIAYLAAADAGAAVLIVRTDGSIRGRLLDFDSATVLDWAGRYLEAEQQQEADPDGWARTLRELTAWLGDHLWRDILDLAGDGDRIALVPAGLLGVFPLHAAAQPDANKRTGIRYALDDRLITYAPNARAMEASRTRARQRAGDSALVVGAPERRDLPPLPHAEREATAVHARFAASRLLAGVEATREAILDELEDHSVLHFACHGRGNLGDPLASALLAAGDDVVTLRDLLERRLPRARLAVLSACETAMAGVALPDEVVSLPTGLLQAGVAGVVGTLWRVPDLGTMLLVRRFYEELARPAAQPAEALRIAQRWLRDATNEEMHNAFPDVPELSPPPLPDSLKSVWRQTFAYADLHHWASFVYIGA